MFDDIHKYHPSSLSAKRAWFPTVQLSEVFISIARQILICTSIVASSSLAAENTLEYLHKPQIAGIEHFSMLAHSRSAAGAVVGFGGATAPEAMDLLKQTGFKTVINLRLEEEDAANVVINSEAAQNAGLSYLHLPFNPLDPKTLVIDDFLRILNEKSNQPVYIHCNSATRVAALWMIHRVLRDGWSIEHASNEVDIIAKKPGEAIAFASAYINQYQ